MLVKSIEASFNMIVWMWKWLQAFVRLLCKFVYTKIEDMISFRNTICLIMLWLSYEAIQTKDGIVVGAVWTVTGLVIGFYFHARNEHQKNGNGLHHSEFPEAPK